MGWNFRVMRHTNVNPISREREAWFEIHEVYYDDEDNVNGWTENGVAPFSDTEAGLKWNLDKMQEALNKPILNYDTGKEI